MINMRYIRTKDGHIAKVIKYYEEDGIYIIERNGKPYFSVFEENVLKQADTIEELCDRFVAIHKTLKGTDCITISLQGMLKEGFSIDTWNIFGAIWTDKGLIYVAKMNDKGELELI